MPDLGPNQRGEAFGGLIEHQQAGVGHERAANRQHLLLATGEVGPQVTASLLQARKQRIDPLQGPGLRAAQPVVRRGDQVLVHREVGKHLSLLRHQANAQAGDLVGGQPGDVLAGKHNAPATGRPDAHDGTHGGGFTHAIAPQHGHELTFGNRQAHPKQGLGVTVEGLQLLHLQQRRHAGSSSSPR